MKQVDLYGRVRHSVLIEGISQREAARIFGIDPRTVAKMLAFSVPPGYRRRQRVCRPKLDAFTGIIDQILEADKLVPKKQRHTSKRVFERLRDDHNFIGGITIVKDYIFTAKQRQQEMFIPLTHPPGHAQADFGEALAVIGGVEQKIHFLVMDLPHSDACFLKAYPAETTEAFCDAHVAAFAVFGGVACVDPVRQHADCSWPAFWGTASANEPGCSQNWCPIICLKIGLAAPEKGMIKVKSKGWSDTPGATSWFPNPGLPALMILMPFWLERCCKRMDDKLRGHKGTIGERFEADAERLQPLPAVPYDACDKQSVRVSSLSLVRYRSNDYSVPTAYGHQEVLVRGYVHEVVIACGAEVIARHARSWEKEDYIYDPLHYLALIEQKTNALDQAAPLADWNLPEAFIVLRRLMEARMGKKGKREFVQVLRLLETFRIVDVEAGVQSALEHGISGFDAVKHLVLCRIERRPPRLDMTVYPYLPKAHVAVTSPGDYMALLSGDR